MHLSHSLLSPYNSRNCIIRCIGASSTDNFPEETIENTLEPIDHVEMSLSYWSSAGQRDPSFPECLIYMLHSDLCLIDEIKIQPFQGLCGNISFSHAKRHLLLIFFTMQHFSSTVTQYTQCSTFGSGWVIQSCLCALNNLYPMRTKVS